MVFVFDQDIVVQTQDFVVGQDREVPIPGFFVLAPVRKIRCIDELADHELETMILLLAKIRKGMREVLGIHDIYLFQNEDTRHDFHLWLFPRYLWMDQFGRGIESVRPIMRHAVQNMMDEEIIAAVRDAVEKMKQWYG